MQEGNRPADLLRQKTIHNSNNYLGEPNNLGFENCVEMHANDPNFKWNDDTCDERQAFICKARATQDGGTTCPDCGDATEPPGVCK